MLVSTIDKPYVPVWRAGCVSTQTRRERERVREEAKRRPRNRKRRGWQRSRNVWKKRSEKTRKKPSGNCSIRERRQGVGVGVCVCMLLPIKWSYMCEIGASPKIIILQVSYGCPSTTNLVSIIQFACWWWCPMMVTNLLETLPLYLQ